MNYWSIFFYIVRSNLFNNVKRTIFSFCVDSIYLVILISATSITYNSDYFKVADFKHLCESFYYCPSILLLGLPIVTFL